MNFFQLSLKKICKKSSGKKKAVKIDCPDFASVKIAGENSNPQGY